MPNFKTEEQRIKWNKYQNEYKKRKNAEAKMKLLDRFKDQKSGDDNMARNLVKENKEKQTENIKEDLVFPEPENEELKVILSGNEQYILFEIMKKLEVMDQKINKGFKAVGVEDIDA